MKYKKYVSFGQTFEPQTLESQSSALMMRLLPSFPLKKTKFASWSWGQRAAGSGRKMPKLTPIMTSPTKI